MITQALLAKGTSAEAYLSYDPYWDQTVALFHAEGTNGDYTPLVDSRGVHTWNMTGGLANYIEFSTAQYVYGSSSINYITTGGFISQAIASPADFRADGDFTIEMRIYRTSTTGKGLACHSNTSDLTCGWDLYVEAATNSLRFKQWDDADNLVVDLTGSAVSLNTWYAVAVVRDTVSDTVRMYVDGVKVSESSTGTPGTENKEIMIGYSVHVGGVNNWRGYLDEIRFTKAARYHGDAYVVRTSAFPDSGA